MSISYVRVSQRKNKDDQIHISFQLQLLNCDRPFLKQIIMKRKLSKIGRSIECDVIISKYIVSRKQAQLVSYKINQQLINFNFQIANIKWRKGKNQLMELVIISRASRKQILQKQIIKWKQKYERTLANLSSQTMGQLKNIQQIFINFFQKTMSRAKAKSIKFSEGSVIVVGEGAQQQVFKVLEDFDGKDEKGIIKAALLKESTRADGKIQFHVDKPIEVPLKDKPKRVFDVEVIPAKGKGRGKQQPETIQLNQNQLELAVQQFQVKCGKSSQLKNQFSESSAEEKKPQQVQKKVGIKKAALQTEIEDPKPVRRKGGKRASSEEQSSESDEDSPQPQKIEVVKNKRGRKPATQTVKGEPQKVEKKEDENKIKPNTSADSQEIQEKKQNKPQKPKKLYQKQMEALQRNGGLLPGVSNTSYPDQVKEHKQLQNKIPEFKDYQSIQINNKEIIRAAYIQSLDLFDDVISRKHKISTLFERWGPENNFNALELMFQNGNKEMVEHFCKKFKERKIQFTSIPQCSLKEIDTGYNDQYAYGARTRKVTTGRGNRQGNNAFVSDLAQEQTLTQETIKNLLTNPRIKNVQLFDKLSAMDIHIQHQIFEQIPTAVRAGNLAVAKHLVEKALKAGNTYGYNWLHLECLGFNRKKIQDIEKKICTKKNTGIMQVTPLHMAAINSDPSYLKYILEKAEKYDIQDELGRKAIHYAAVSENDKCLQYLLGKKANPRERDKLEYTPLMLAAQYGKLACLKTLLHNCAENINLKNKEGNAAIHLAAQYGHLDCLIELLSKNALPKQPGQNGSQPIHLAAAYGHFHIVKFLKDQAKANINSIDKYGRTPLAMAARNGNLEILSYLLKNGADYRINDSSGNSPMHYAAAYGFAECLLELKKAGADQYFNNSSHLTPLGVALAKNHYSIVKEILNFPETDVNCKDDEGKTLLISSLVKFKIESLDYIKFLVEEKNAIVTEEDQLKKTALHYAVQLSAKTYKRTIFQFGSMPKSKRQEYKKTYREAILDLVKLFISRGASINAPDSLGVTPFMTAVKERQTDLIQYFIEKCEPQFGVTDGSDKNLLHIMIENKSYVHPVRYNIFRTILKKFDKDQIKGVDENGYSPLVYMIKEFTSTSTQLYNINLQQILVKEQLAKMEEYLQNVDPKELVQNNSNLFGQNLFQEEDNSENEEDEIDEQEDLRPRKPYKRYARTKVTARYSSFAGKVPQQQQGLFGGGFAQVAPQFQGGLIGQQEEIKTYGQFSFNIGNNQTKTIGFTQDQYKTFQDQAMVEAKKQEDKVLDLIVLFLKKGAQLNEYVRKNKQFRKHNPKKVVTENPYNAESKKQIQHYIFQNFPNKMFLQNLENQLGGLQLDFNQKSQHGQTPLHLFCLNPANQNIFNSSGALTIRSEFLKYSLDELNVNIDIKDKQGRTATHILAVNFEEPLLDLLLGKGGKLNIVSKENVVPIIHHVNRQDVQTVTKLLAKGADPNFQDLNKRSSLHHAINISSSCTNVSFDVGELLFKKGAKADIKDIFERTPFYYCFVKIGKEFDRSPIDPSETVSTLLAQNTYYGNVYDVFKRTPLHYAAMRDSVYSASYLINKNKVELDGQDIDGNTPIALAFLCGHQNFVKTMIDSKAQITGSAIYNDRKKIEQEYIKEYKEKNNVLTVNLEIDTAVLGSAPQQQQQAFGYKQPRQAKAQAFGGQSLFGQQVQEQEYIQDNLGGISFPTRFSFIPVAGNIKPDKFTFFKLAITHGWQNIAYLLIQSGSDLFTAFEDSLKSQQFELVKRLLSKVTEKQVRDKTNNLGQNLFHLFAQFAQSAERHIYDQILAQLERKLIPFNTQDNSKRTPLHYAAKIGFDTLVYYLLNKKVSPNDVDSDQNTPYSYALQRDYSSVLSKIHFPIWQEAGFDIKSKFKVNDKNYQLDTFMYLIQEKLVEDELFLDALLQKGSDINSLNQDKETALFLSVRSNNETFFKFLISKTREARIAHQINSKNESIFHVVVQPLPYGSYENTFMLRELIDAFLFGSIMLQVRRSGKMAAILKNNYGEELIKVNLIPPAIESAQYPEDFPQFEAHAKEYIEENQNTREEDKSIIDPRLEVDPQVKQQAGKYEPYSLIMTKVDVANGLASENLIHETNKDVYILFTRWGRIGTPGQLQMTPFDKPNAIKEFHSIFKIKSGNIWQEIIGGKPFQAQPNKYLFQNIQIKRNYKQLMQPFDFSRKNKHPYPQHHLEKNFCQVQLYQRELQQIRVDHEFLPLESLEKDQLQRAKNILKEIEEFVLELEREKKQHKLNDERIFELFASINEKSSRYFQLIPCIDYRNEPIPPLETLQQIRSQSMIVETLLNFEFTSKILLGALKYAQKENPLTYCFKSMQIRVQTLIKEQPEYQMVQTYVKVTSEKTRLRDLMLDSLFNQNNYYGMDQRYPTLWLSQLKEYRFHHHGLMPQEQCLERESTFKIHLRRAMLTLKTLVQHKIGMVDLEVHLEVDLDMVITDNTIHKIKLMMMKNRMRYKDIDIYCCARQQQNQQLQKTFQVNKYIILETFSGFDSIKGCGTNVPDIKQQVKPENDKDIYHLGHNEYIIYDEEQLLIKNIKYKIQIQIQNIKYIFIFIYIIMDF
ncbi:hypothetical protein pb186bvf_013782, partial [Paramecium bursaria]